MMRRFPLSALLLILFIIAFFASSCTSGSSGSSDGKGGIIINEVMPKAGDNGCEWVEIINQNNKPLDISGYEIESEGGVVYTFPEALPPVPYKTYVLVKFDGSIEADDLSFIDGVATLHADLTDAGGLFGDASGYAALFSGTERTAGSVVSFIAWGAPQGGSQDIAVSAGKWSDGRFISFARGGGSYTNDDLFATNESIGLIPGLYVSAFESFAVYRGDSVTPGAANKEPLPSFFTPYYNETLENNEVVFNWTPVEGADSYLFELAYNDDFFLPVVSEELQVTMYKLSAGQPQGKYYWRITPVAAGDTGAAENMFAPAGNVSAIHYAAVPINIINRDEIVIRSRHIDVPFIYQRKDTSLLCLGGCVKSDADPSSLKTAWDEEHLALDTDTGTLGKIRPNDDPHSNSYCLNAVISMVNAYYGGSLSQDRISYYMTNESRDAEVFPPEYDLWHGFNGGLNALTWALGLNGICQEQLDCPPYIYYYETMTDFNSLKAGLDEDRPFIANLKVGQSIVIDGYKEILSGNKLVHVHDPWSGEHWAKYDGLEIKMMIALPDKSLVTQPRSDEASVHTDSDGDGITDFDETNRFFTSTASTDSDLDGISDKIDIASYIFDAGGNYKYAQQSILPYLYSNGAWVQNTAAIAAFDANADYDGDLLRKEVDGDNDGDGSKDGCEDYNQNGVYEPDLGETDNFNASSINTCYPEFSLSVLSLDFGGDTESLTITVVNSKYIFGDIEYSVAIDDDWITADKTSGTLVADEDVITFTVSRESLFIGTYTTTVHFTSNGGDFDVGVTMAVTEISGIIIANIAADPEVIYQEACSQDNEATISCETAFPTGNTVSIIRTYYKFSDEHTWKNIDMSPDTASGKYQVVLGPFDRLGTMEYHIFVKDSSGASKRSKTFTFPVYECSGPEISNINVTANPVYLNDCYLSTLTSVTCDVTDDSGVESVVLKYKINAGEFIELPMDIIATGEYSATIGPFTAEGRVYYQIEAADIYGNTAISAQRNIAIVDCMGLDIHITGITESADPINLSGIEPDTITISCTATADSGISKMEIYFTSDMYTTSWETRNMTYDPIADNYSIEFGPYANSTVFYYYIKVYDNDNNYIKTDIYSFNVDSVPVE